MLELRIPEESYGVLAELLKLSDDQWDAIRRALDAVAPVLPSKTYRARLARYLENTLPDAESLVRALTEVLTTRSQLERSDDEFFRDFRAAMKATNKPDLDPDKADWESFVENLKRLLTKETSIEVTGKASTLQAEQERVFTDARILTDLRPIFAADVDVGATAMMINHTLRITFATMDRVEEIYLGMDMDDLKALRTAITRALKKHKLLNDKLKEWNMRCLSGCDEEQGP